MFWDDEMYEKVTKNYPKTEKDITNMIRGILCSAFELMVEEGKFNDNNMLNAVKRMDSRWRLLAKRLEKDRYPLMADDGLKLYIMKQTNLKQIVKLLKW